MLIFCKFPKNSTKIKMQWICIKLAFKESKIAFELAHDYCHKILSRLTQSLCMYVFLYGEVLIAHLLLFF